MLYCYGYILLKRSLRMLIPNSSNEQNNYKDYILRRQEKSRKGLRL